MFNNTEPIVVLQEQGTFWPNYYRALLVMLCHVALLAALGHDASSEEATARALQALDADPAEARAAVSAAKALACKTADLAVREGVQMHGGIGMTDEYIASHYFKRLTVIEMSYGDSLHQLGEVSARMQDTAGVFA